MDDTQKLNEEFQNYVRQAIEKWDLIEGMLLIARHEYPDLDSGKYTFRVNEMAREAANQVATAQSKLGKLGRLNQFFFVDVGFKGNEENYYDPRNSYLPDLLDRKLGIPITLSALYLKFAWDSGCPLFGINFPGRFLVAWKESESEVDENLYIDPFDGGKVLNRHDLAAMLAKRNGQTVKVEPALHLRNAGVRDILHRMLANLKAIHASNQRTERALWAADWMLMIKSNDWDSMRDKGMLYYSLGRYDEAEKALETYLEKMHRPPDMSQVYQVLYAIRALGPAHLN